MIEKYMSEKIPPDYYTNPKYRRTWPVSVRNAVAKGAIGLSRAYLGPIHILGLENVQHDAAPKLIAPTHNSMMDIPITAYAARKAGLDLSIFMYKQELRYPVVRTVFDRLGGVAVDRDGYGNRALLELQIAQLRGGQNVGVFPEGTRGNKPADCAVGELFGGVGFIAARAHVDVQPLAIAGSGNYGDTLGPIVGVFGRTITIAATDDHGLNNTALRREVTEQLSEELQRTMRYAYNVRDEYAVRAGLA
jgi:1-acyl-sn-glycerol-3-phosphate acyltransferase